MIKSNPTLHWVHCPVCHNKTRTKSYISNLKDSPYGNWNDMVVDEFVEAYRIVKITTEKHKIDFEN